MSEADLFLNAIFDNPDDDTPRLVYADWLQEHGQEDYAHFIRLQCAAAREKLWSNAANDLWVQIGRVWTRLSKLWWPATVETWWINHDWRLLDAVHFERGLLSSKIPYTAKHILRCGECWPWLPSPGSTLLLTLEDDTDLRDVVSLAFLQRIRDVVCRSGTEESNLFLQTPHLSNLRFLDLADVTLVRSTLDILLSASHLGSIEEIAINGNMLDLDSDNAIQQLKSRFKTVTVF